MEAPAITRPGLGSPSLTRLVASLHPSTPLTASTWLLQTEAHTGTYSLASLVGFSLTSRPHLTGSYSLTVFSPSGKLVQIEHALAAVSSGTTSLGIKGPHAALLPRLDSGC